MLTCKFENDQQALLRHVVVNLIILKDQQMLLAKRAPHLLAANQWALIGGFMDRDETLEQAAIREAREETGYKVKIHKLFRVVDNPKRRGEDRQNVCFIYIASAVEKVGEPDKESTELMWFDFDKLPKKHEFAFDHYEQIQRYLAVKD